MNDASKRALRDLRNGVVDYNSPEGRKMMEDAILQDPIAATKAMNFIPREQIVRTMRTAGFTVGEIGHILIPDQRERAEFIKDNAGIQAAAASDPTNPFASGRAQAEQARGQQIEQDRVAAAKKKEAKDDILLAGVLAGAAKIIQGENEEVDNTRGLSPFDDPEDEIANGPRPRWA